jgi:DNA-binding NtrC family response regulator
MTPAACLLPPPDDDDNLTQSELPAVPAHAWVLEICDPWGLARHRLREGEERALGSRGGAAIAVHDPAVSGRHCSVRVERGRLEIADLSSRNGLWAAGARAESLQFEEGGCFVVGRTLIACRPEREEDSAELLAEPPLEGVVGQSLAMRRVARQVRLLAPLRAPVLVRGETGAGKELIAQALHTQSQRAPRPFVALNMGALPGELADAELFGHERGAFTGASVARPGAFEAARGGTLFLDEVAELPMAAQAKLLRALEGGEVRALGATASRRVEVRVVAATWAPLDRRVVEGAFREDLFHRLAVLQVALPPLRERRGDIGLLAGCFLEGISAELGERALTAGALSRLAAHGWPGNVRELRNVLLRAAICAEGRLITPEHVERAIGRAPASAGRSLVPADRRIEAKATLAAHEGNVSSAARALGVARSTLRAWTR